MTDSDTPRTTSGMELLHRMSWNVKSAALWRERILAIEAEAAQPAPLDVDVVAYDLWDAATKIGPIPRVAYRVRYHPVWREYAVEYARLAAEAKP